VTVVRNVLVCARFWIRSKFSPFNCVPATGAFPPTQVTAGAFETVYIKSEFTTSAWKTISVFPLLQIDGALFIVAAALGIALIFIV
jgi:hypothetical protein